MGPDTTAIRVAMWRAMHVLIDAAPHVLEDSIGLELVDPHDSWRERPDMDPMRTRRSRAAIVARTRFIEDLVAARGLSQYVLLGAGLDTFAQRKPSLASRMQVFEMEQAATQAWKRKRLVKLGYAIPPWLHLVPVDFEADVSWLDQLVSAGFDARAPAVIASTGVVMYLTRDAIAAMLRQVSTLAPGSTLAMSFMLPPDLIEPAERPFYLGAAKGARTSGKPLRSLFSPREMLALAREAGLADVLHVSASDLEERYFSGRADGLRPSSAEELLVATT